MRRWTIIRISDESGGSDVIGPNTDAVEVVPLSEVREALLGEVAKIRGREKTCRTEPTLRESPTEKAERLGWAAGLDNAAAGLEGFINIRFPSDSEEGKQR